VVHILVVDDEEAILFALEEYVRARGCMIHAAREFEEAHALLSNIQYHLVVTDLRLGGIHRAEGLDVVSMVRECCPQTKVMVLTAYGDAAMEAEATRRGAHAFLHKSMPLRDIAQVAMELLGQAA
jgi:DNA-binding NtrC family response regulator